MDSSTNQFMHRALELAALGRGSVSPNPMVGCVIVHDGKIIGEGYHQRYGGPHAEVNAVDSVIDKELLKECTAFVTLEPCTHFGKTPPCADLLIEKKVKEVIIASGDPFEEVDGNGIGKLKAAGIKVEIGILNREASELNKRFFTFHQKERPYVILKWAQTSDGFIARENHDSKWISNTHSRQLVHKWRTEEDAILIGKNTALFDNPSLTAREWKGKNPIRILLDRNLEVNLDSNIFDGTTSTFILNSKKDKEKGSNRWIKIERLKPSEILKKLHALSIQSIIIEGGAAVLNSFIGDNCWDEARIFISKESFGKGMKAPELKGVLKSEEAIFEDQLKIMVNDNG
ncbi:MAG: bifunctional diaminohydroxyphosphoribosylaminopyrimidine deaminase/5-amino-6-(5-phosphoribosylamino)uracil reductase RibD [Cyclobacteriaceae bacterium]